MGKIVFNPSLCTGCRACELACSFYCEGIFAPSKSRIRVVKMDWHGIDVPTGCQHCEDAPCMLVCPVKAIYRDEDTSAVLVDYDACIGCKECMVACPFGAMHFDEEKRIVYKCDLCFGDPECVNWCFTKAIEYVENMELLPEEVRAKHALKVAKSGQASRKLASF